MVIAALILVGLLYFITAWSAGFCLRKIYASKNVKCPWILEAYMGLFWPIWFPQHLFVDKILKK